jgi:hypothetical protein
MVPFPRQRHSAGVFSENRSGQRHSPGRTTPPPATNEPAWTGARFSCRAGRAALSFHRTTQGGGFCSSARAMVPSPRQRHSAGVFRRSATFAPPFPSHAQAPGFSFQARDPLLSGGWLLLVFAAGGVHPSGKRNRAGSSPRARMTIPGPDSRNRAGVFPGGVAAGKDRPGVRRRWLPVFQGTTAGTVIPPAGTKTTPVGGVHPSGGTTRTGGGIMSACGCGVLPAVTWRRVLSPPTMTPPSRTTTRRDVGWTTGGGGFVHPLVMLRSDDDAAV